MTKESLFLVKWINLMTSAFGFSTVPQPFDEATDLAARMTLLTPGRWYDDENRAHNYRGKYLVIPLKEV